MSTDPYRWTTTAVTPITGHQATFTEDGTEWRDNVPAVLTQVCPSGETRIIAAVFDIGGCLVPVTDEPFDGEFAGVIPAPWTVKHS